MKLITKLIERLVDTIHPAIHPSKMTPEEIQNELAAVWAKPYSRKDQRRAALLLGFDSKEQFGAEPSEEVFERVIGFTMLVSLSIRGRPTTKAHELASMMLYRICVIGRTITAIYESHQASPEQSLDYGSIAVLCRTLFDASIMYFYLTEDVTADEWAFRLAVLKVHDTASRVRLFKAYGEEEAEDQRQHLTRLKEELSKLPLFQARNQDEQTKLLSGQQLYVNGMRSLLRSMDIGHRHFDGLYNYLFAHVHLSPLSYFRARTSADNAMDIVFARGFMQLCLHEAAQFVVRVALREIELSKLEGIIGETGIEQMKAFCRTIKP